MHPRGLIRRAALLAALASAAGAGGAEPPSAPIRFEEVAAASGLAFRFDDGSRGRHDLPEVMGGGVALIDFDGDGRLDIYLCNGGPIVPEAGRADPPCRLFRNEGGWRFADATDRAEIPGPSYAMGAAVGDYDGDGLDDLLVTGWRDQRLYRNLGGGRFRDETERAGVGSKLWGTSAAFADLDGDGDLDLYVANYLDYDPALAPLCLAPDGRADYCGPEEFRAQAGRLYRNEGDGTFADVSRASGIERPDGRGLGVLIADLAGDGRPDLYVANDGTPCRLFENRGGLRFAEVGLETGVALDGRGDSLAGMGVALGDVDGDGRLDLVVSNFVGRSTVGFRRGAGGSYDDASGAFGLAAPTRPVLGFGLALADFDSDGRLDLLQGNGHVLDRGRLGVPFAMRPTLLGNRRGRLVDASAAAGPWFARATLARGLAVGDLDSDGRVDAVVAALGGPPALLRNVTEGGRSLLVELVASGRSGRSAVGAKVEAKIGGRTLARQVVGGGSYLAASDRRVHLGLGDAPKVDRIEVTWPSGRSETWRDLPAGRPVRLEEGQSPRSIEVGR